MSIRKRVAERPRRLWRGSCWFFTCLNLYFTCWIHVRRRRRIRRRNTSVIIDNGGHRKIDIGNSWLILFKNGRQWCSRRCGRCCCLCRIWLLWIMNMNFFLGVSDIIGLQSNVDGFWCIWLFVSNFYYSIRRGWRRRRSRRKTLFIFWTRRFCCKNV